MKEESLFYIFINASLINNFVLAYFLGICPFLGVSGKMETATKMGGAVTFVMIVASMCAYGIHSFLVAINAPFLQLISYIVVIASTVQLVEMFIEKFSPALYGALGIFLPLIAVNCAILGGSLFMVQRDYTLSEAGVFGVGSGLGFMFAIVALAAIREKLKYSNVPDGLKGLGITMLITGLMGIAFKSFIGIAL